MEIHPVYFSFSQSMSANDVQYEMASAKQALPNSPCRDENNQEATEPNQNSQELNVAANLRRRKKRPANHLSNLESKFENSSG
jgi:hypothetical protein